MMKSSWVTAVVIVLAVSSATAALDGHAFTVTEVDETIGAFIDSIASFDGAILPLYDRDTGQTQEDAEAVAEAWGESIHGAPGISVPAEDVWYYREDPNEDPLIPSNVLENQVSGPRQSVSAQEAHRNLLAALRKAPEDVAQVDKRADGGGAWAEFAAFGGIESQLLESPTPLILIADRRAFVDQTLADRDETLRLSAEVQRELEERGITMNYLWVEPASPQNGMTPECNLFASGSATPSGLDLMGLAAKLAGVPALGVVSTLLKAIDWNSAPYSSYAELSHAGELWADMMEAGLVGGLVVEFSSSGERLANKVVGVPVAGTTRTTAGDLGISIAVAEMFAQQRPALHRLLTLDHETMSMRGCYDSTACFAEFVHGLTTTPSRETRTISEAGTDASMVSWFPMTPPLSLDVPVPSETVFSPMVQLPSDNRAPLAAVPIVAFPDSVSMLDPQGRRFPKGWKDPGIGFSDPDGDPLRFYLGRSPRKGTANLMTAGKEGQYAVTVMYYIDRDDALLAHTGEVPYIDHFTVVATDPFGATAETRVEVAVDVINTPPVCVDDEATTPMGTAIDIDVLANDSDVDEDELSVVVDSGPSFGASSVSHIMIRYEPLTGFYGDDTFTYTAADGYGGETAATVTVHVVDTEPPVFVSGPGDIGPLVNDLGVCGAAVTWTEPMIGTDVTDNIGVADLTCTHAPDDVFAIGSTTVTYTAADPSGNATDHAFTVTIEDQEPPMIDAMPSDTCVEAAEGETEAVVTWTPPTASDNCDVADLTSSHAPGDVFPLGDTQVTYIAEDVHGNVASDAFTVTVAGRWHLVCTDVEVSTNNPGGTVVTFDDPIVGGCAVDYTFDPTSGSTFPIGDTLVICEATDGVRNETCTFTVSVDFFNQPPNAVNDFAQMAVNQIAIEIDVLANDSDPDGDHLTIDDVGTCSPCGEAWIGPSGGSVWFLATYCQPFLGGTARFTYTISDGHGGADTATVVIGLPDSGTMPEVAPPQGGDR